MEVNFDKLQDEILDLQERRNNENEAVAMKIRQWLKQRGKDFDFSEIKTQKATTRVSYFNREDGMRWMERYDMGVDTLHFNKEENDFEAIGTIDGSNEPFVMFGRDLDLESLYRIVDWLALYQKEQNGTAKSPKQLEAEFNAERFGKEYSEKEAYRDYIDNQCSPEERLMISLYFGASEEQKPFMPLSPRAKFAIFALKEL